ncbi:polysaccharide biosynthesis C-terminal domain-containing protein [Microbispora bryophytorum]|uniref:oligosaccharide flippase family protein n=1 Tax=Microbispora bryophytorum TaxID=1460882 RepID=UPI0033D199FA
MRLMTGPVTAVAGVLASRMIRVALGAVTGVLIARTLLPEGRGVYAVMTTAAATAVVVGHLSLEKSHIVFWPDSSRHRPLITNALVLGTALGFVAALATFGIVAASASPGAFPLWAVALLAVPFGTASINLTSVLLLQSRTKTVNRATTIAALTQCLPILALMAAGKVTVASAVVCWAASTVVPFLFAVRALWPIPLRPDKNLVRRQLSLSGRYHVGWVAYHMLLSVDILLLNAMDSAATVGIYTVAGTLMTLARIPADSITQVVLPRQAVSGAHEAERLTARTLRLNLLVSAAFIGLVAAASPWAIPLVYGHAFAASVAPLLVLAPGALALTVTRPTEQYLVRLGRPMTMTAIACTALAVNLVLNLVLIPHWGAVGAALASTVAYTLLALLETAWFLRSARVGVSELVPRLTDLRALSPRTPAATGTAERRTGASAPAARVEGAARTERTERTEKAPRHVP